MPDLMSEPEGRLRGRIDPVRVAVQGVLALYLLPVILLVAAIGVTSIVVVRLAGLIVKAVSLVPLGQGRHSPQNLQPGGQTIGSTPIAGWRPKRSRVIR
jgi:hypothetical protein